MRTGILAQFLSLFVWQVGLILQKLLVVQSSVATILVLQLGLAAMVLWAAQLILRRHPPVSTRSLANLGWGLMAPGLVFVLGIAGAARTDGVSIALIWGLFPLIGPLVARLVIGEPAHWSVYGGGLLAFIGVALLTAGRAESGSSDMAGNGLILAAVLCAAFNATIGRVMNRNATRWFDVATLQVTGAALGAGVVMVFAGWHPPSLSVPSNGLALAFLVLFMTVANFLAFNFALARLPVALIALNASFAPVFGLLAAWILLGSTLRPADSAYVLFILCGVAMPHMLRYLKDKGSVRRS
ncbi:DMT family transporter [Pseudohoeflea coraliihabitans]|uniref:DMT family transporter n=1 Tax=Pseudohoeflea coraliihabitans TaxID=2860393 RepID=A0ABS6WKY8_9HYPH|nr:DMT family transporter [Pseudohoeflea sp. DP4N28-3]MBW3096622.1 DMT family transporter [Pseudohoeflea sp. DP4N28-3]